MAVWSVPIFVSLVMQVVVIGEMPKDFCNKIEKVRPNLVLLVDTKVVGRITDHFDVPLQNSQVELRKYVNKQQQQFVAMVHTDSSGKFNFGEIRRGQYRLLASPTRGFQQPDYLHCVGRNCDLSIALEVNATDRPDSICPIR